MLEIERTYLAKSLPENIKELPCKETIDIYLPSKINGHAPLRIRKQGDKFEITKKYRLNEDDGSQLIEETINLTKNEFDLLSEEIKGLRVEKSRYIFEYEDKTAEIDIFKGDLEGLVIIEFEFGTEEEMKEFKMPDFCLADVTEEKFIWGGVLCRSTYADLEPKLNEFGYKKF